MAKFCRYCGSSIPEGVKFCPECGKQLIAAEQQPQVRQQSPAPQPPAPQPAREQVRQQPPRQAQPARQSVWQEVQPAQPQPESRGQNAASARTAPQSAAQPLRGSTAPTAGEMDLGEIDLSVFGPASAGVTETAEKVLSPIAGVFSGIGTWFTGIFRLFTKPLALIAVILLGVLWVLLAGDLGDELPFLSWLTFARGGFDRELPGAVLGTLGKGAVGAAILSLFSGGLKSLFQGLGALFVGHGEKRGFFGIVFGIVIGGLVYLAFAGMEASAETAMAGVAGAVLSLEALGGGSGRLYKLTQSLTSRSIGGVRTARRGKADGLLTGLTLGFGIMTALSAAGVWEGLL